MVDVTAVFRSWWNVLAKVNGKDELRTYKQAADFVRQSYKKSGGPSKELKELFDDHQKFSSDTFTITIDTKQ